MDYIAYLHKDRNSDFGVSFPDFPGCITVGKTLEEARRKAAEALSFHVAGMLADNEKIPNHPPLTTSPKITPLITLWPSWSLPAWSVPSESTSPPAKASSKESTAWRDPPA
jgi:predicted RNase H-like HicB family nuclease